MNISLDITNEFEKFKESYTCLVCKKILRDPVILRTCKHVQCRHCVGKNKCTICKCPHNSVDVVKENIVGEIVKGIEDIECLFCDVIGDSQHSQIIQGVEIVVAKTVLKRNPKGETPLHIACQKGNLEKVIDLIREGVDLNVRDYANWTPLHEAVQRNHLECVELLLKNGALVDVPGSLYTTPLHKAVALCFYQVVEILLTYGASTKVVDFNGFNATNLPTTSEISTLLRDNIRNVVLVQKIFMGPHVIVYSPSINTLNKNKLIKRGVKFITCEEFVKRDEVTHYIMKDKENIDIEFLLAITKGAFIVRESWIDAYLQTSDRTSFDHIPEKYEDIVKRAVENKLKQLPKLFDGINFHIIGHKNSVIIHGMKVYKKDIVNLIESGGGKILTRPPAERTAESNVSYPYHVDRSSTLSSCCHYIIYGENNVPQLLYQMRELRHMSSKWLIDCIIKFCVSE